MVKEYLDIDIAHGRATFKGEEVDVAVPVLVTMEERKVVWQSDVAVPLVLEDWLVRIMGQFSALKADMQEHWPEVAVHVNWWMKEPGEDPEYPHGLQA